MMNKTTLMTILGAAAIGLTKQSLQGSNAKTKSSDLIDLFEFSFLSNVNANNIWHADTFFDFFNRPKCRYSQNESWGSCGGWKSNKSELKQISKLGHDRIGSIAFTEVREGKFPPVQLYSNLESLYVDGSYGSIPEEAFANAKWLRNLFLHSSSYLPQSTLNLTRLTNLGFSGTSIDCAVLQNCLKLENLSITVERVSNLQMLGNLKNLKRLSISISDTSKNYDFSFISDLTKLEEVRLLSECHSTIHSSLTGLTKLKKAKVNAIGDQITFDNLSMIPNLKELIVDQGYEYSCLKNYQYTYGERSPFTGSLIINNFNNLESLTITGRGLEISFSSNSCKKLKTARLCDYGSYYERESQGWGAGTKTVRHDNTVGKVYGLENLISLENIKIRLDGYNIWDKISEIQKAFYLRKIKRIDVDYIKPSRWGHTEDKFVNIIPKNMSCTKLEHLDIRGIPVRFIPTAIQKCRNLNLLRIRCPVFDYTNYGYKNDVSIFWPARYNVNDPKASNFDLFIPKQIVNCKKLKTVDIDGLNIYNHFPWKDIITKGYHIIFYKTEENGLKTKEVISSENISDALLKAILESSIFLRHGSKSNWSDNTFLDFNSMILHNYHLQFENRIIPNINIASNDSRIKKFGINLFNNEDSYEAPSRKETSRVIDIEIKNESALNNDFSAFIDAPVIENSAKKITLKGAYKNTEALRNTKHIREIDIDSASIENLVFPFHSQDLERLSISFGLYGSIPLEIQAKMLSDLANSSLQLRSRLSSLNIKSAGVLIPELKYLNSLKHASFYMNTEMTTFPNWILSCKELISLSFKDCPIPSIPEDIGSILPKLEELLLYKTMVQEIPHSLIKSPKFRKLKVDVERVWNDSYRRDFMFTKSSNPRLSMTKMEFISLLPYLNRRDYDGRELVSTLQRLVEISEEQAKSQLRRF